MYCVYKYNSGAATTDLVSDVVALLTGETNVANLSNSCNKAATELYTSYYSAGWTVLDASAGTNTVALTAPCEGDPAQLKYVTIDFATVGFFRARLWEDWDEVSHAGTNGLDSGFNSGYWQRWNTADIGTIYIAANSGMIYMISEVNGAYGDSNNNAPTFVFEGGRAWDWCAVGEGFVPAVGRHGSTSFSVYFFRCKHIYTGAVLSTPTDAKIYVVGAPSSLNTGNTVISFIDYLGRMQGSNATKIATGAFVAPDIGNSTGSGGLSDLNPTKLLWLGAESHKNNLFDEVSYDGKTYVVHWFGEHDQTWQTAAMLVPKG